jgi:GT2 family glycosyltransferase
MGSTDGSVQFIQKAFPGIGENSAQHRLIRNAENLGCAVGRNQGIKAGDSEYICFIDSDIEIRDKEWLEKLKCGLNLDARIWSSEAAVEIHDGTWMFAGGACNMVFRKMFEEIGLFDENFFFGADNDMWARQEWAGIKTAFCLYTDIYHQCGQTIVKVLGMKERERRYNEAHRTLYYKYTQAFLNGTYFRLCAERAEQRDLLLADRSKKK